MPILPSHPQAAVGYCKYLGLEATADQVGFVGLDVFEMENRCCKTEPGNGFRVISADPVVNFSAYDSGAGYEVATGTKWFNHHESQRRIFASYDNVLINVSSYSAERLRHRL